MSEEEREWRGKAIVPFRWSASCALLFWLLSLCSALSFAEGPCEGAPLLSWEELEEGALPASSGEVRIRGFLYRDGEGRWLLAPQPGLRSCCLAKGRQLHVVGEIAPPPPARAVVVGGHLHRGGAEGWSLTEATLLPEEGESGWVRALAVVTAAAALLLARRWRWQRGHKERASRGDHLNTPR